MPNTVDQVTDNTTEQPMWMREQLARYTYRPGWTMTITDQAVLVVRYPAVDARNPGRTLTLQNRRAIDPTWDAEQFGRALAAQLLDIERHESREWLRCDGRLFDDPHTDPTRWHCARCGGVGPIRHEGSSWTCPACAERETPGA